MNDEDSLQAHLDEQPGDKVTRLALADLFEEQSRDDEAKGQRLLAEMGLWPDNDPEPPQRPGWHWWSRAGGKWDKDHTHAVIARDLHRHMPTNGWLYETRREAEAVVLEALRDADRF